MIVSPLKAGLLAILMLTPVASRVRAGDPPEDQTVVVADGEVITLDDGEPMILESGDADEPMIVHSGDDDEPAVMSLGGRRGFLGLRLIGITDDLRKHYGAPENAGVLVSEVEEDSPAAKAGVLVGDVITKVDGREVESSWDLSRQIRRKKKGEQVSIELVRDGRSRAVTATLEERERKAFDFDFDFPGLDRKLRRELGRELDGHRWVIRDREVRRRVHDRLGAAARSLEDRLHDLENRLKDLEKKLSAR